jgi:hypothetical protein
MAGERRYQGPLYCARCDVAVEPIRVWGGFRVGWAIWRVGLIGVLALTPFLASDYCVMLPSMMLYLAAGGPLRALARTRPVCPRCSLELVEGQRTGEPLRRADPSRAR